MIFLYILLYALVGFIHFVTLVSNGKIETNSECTAAFVFWPIYFVGYIFKLVFYIGKLFFDTVTSIVKDVFNI